MTPGSTKIIASRNFPTKADYSAKAMRCELIAIFMGSQRYVFRYLQLKNLVMIHATSKMRVWSIKIIFTLETFTKS